jgi:uncharacterized membrane protein
LTPFDFPNAHETFVEDINDGGQIVGGYASSTGNNHGYLLDHGIYTSLDTFDVTYASPYAINGSGQIAGTYTIANEVHGFLATPVTAAVPVPAAIWLFASGLAGLGIIGRKK